ncbi:ATP-binding protein [Megalodesulfovibrio paquesii]
MLGSTRSRIVLLTALSALPALCILLYNGWEQRQQRVIDAKASMLLLAKGIAEVQQRHVESTRQLLNVLALMDSVRDRDAAACARLFAQILKTHSDYTNIVAADSTGDVFASGVPFDPINLADRKHFQEALTTGRFSAGEFIISRSTHENAFPLSLPVFDEQGQVVAVITAALKLDSYAGYLDEVGAPQQVILGITDHEGIRLFYHPPAPTNVPGKPINPVVWAGISSPAADEGVMQQTGSDGVERYLGWKRLRLRPDEPPYIYCVAGLPKTVALETTKEISRRSIALWLLVALLGCGGAYLYGNAAVVRQLTAISRAATALGRGDFSARTGLPHREDDLGQLARTFDAMAERIQSHDADRNKAEEALRLSEERFRKLLDVVETVAVQGYSMDRKVVYWNKASELLYGYTAEEAMGRDLVELIIPPAMRPQVREFVHRMGTTDFIIPAAELELQRKDGTLAPVFSSHVRVEVGDRLEMFCLDVDLTGLKQAEAEARKAQRVAEEANAAKSIFLANMSHEIRTPLNGILGMLQLLQLTALSADQHLYVEKAIHSSRRLTRLLSDILDLSQVESGRLALHPAPFRVQDLQDAVLELFTGPASQKGLSLSMRVDPDLPAVLVGDEIRLRQILFNLVNNAIKFTEQGQVRVELTALSPSQESQPRMLISVHDTGIGIPPDKLSDLFSPFAQLDASTSLTTHSADRGAGLGLAIVRRLTELMGGHITVDSLPGEGTSIHVMTPLALPDQSASVETAPALPPREHNQPPAAAPLSPATASDETPLHVLVAEDDDLNRMVAHRLLSQAGHLVTCAENGAQALELLQRTPCNCILMDIQMPMVDGLEATRRIRAGEVGEALRDIPIIALTAHAMRGDRERFLQAGMDSYLEKPLAAEKLLEAVTSCRRWTPGA